MHPQHSLRTYYACVCHKYIKQYEKGRMNKIYVSQIRSSNWVISFQQFSNPTFWPTMATGESGDIVNKVEFTNFDIDGNHFHNIRRWILLGMILSKHPFRILHLALSKHPFSIDSTLFRSDRISSVYIVRK